MMRRAFTLLELLLVCGVLAVLAGVATPVYRDYRIRNDLHTAAELLRQTLQHARILAQAGHSGAAWGVDIPSRTLFAGATYETRDVRWDAPVPLPGAVMTTGMRTVVFAPITGEPSATGAIVLTSLRGERATVSVIVDRQGIGLSIDDRLTICHCDAAQPLTLRIPEAAWPAHRKHGDHMGACDPVDPWHGCTNEKNR